MRLSLFITALGQKKKKILEYWFGIGGVAKCSVEDMALKLNKTPAQIRDMSKKLAEQIRMAGG